MLGPGSASAISTAYDLGPVIDFSGPVARGELGEIWRLITASGSWAVKTTFTPLSAAEAEVPARVSSPGPSAGRSRTHGASDPRRLLARGGGRQCHPGVRVGRDERARHTARSGVGRPDRGRPAPDGAAYPRMRPHEWYTEPVGAAAWAAIVTEAERQQAAVRRPDGRRL